MEGTRAIGLVAADLDGTILRADMTTGERTISVITRLGELAIPFIICTARAPVSTIPIARMLGVREGFAVCNSGGVIIDLLTEQIVHRHPFPTQDARRMVEVLRARVPGIAFTATIEGRWFREPHYVIDPVTLTTLAMIPEVAADALEILSQQEPTKMFVGHSDLRVDELHSHVADALAVIGLSHAVNGAGFIEVLGPGVDKAAGVAWVADNLGIVAADTVAFGDERPDIPMLAWAGLGVAVANAHPEVLAMADRECGSVDDDGVAIFLDAVLAAQ